MPIDLKRPTLIDSLTGGTHQWTTGTGSIGIFTVNGDAAESERLYDTDPFGNSSIVWQTNPTAVSGPDGGWNTSYFSIDNTKMYRFSVWIRRTLGTGIAAGDFYFGCTGSADVLYVTTGAAQSNPYWSYGDITLLTLNTWYLLVAHVFPADYRTGDYTIVRHPETGYYTRASGKIGSQLGSNNIGGDAVFSPSTTSIRHRTYHFYSTTTSAHLQFFDPRIQVCDGSEGTVLSLLNRDSADGPGNVLASTSITKEGASYKHQNVVATGGDWIEDFGEWRSHVFTGSSSFVVDSYVGSALRTDYLIVGGGGGGGGRRGGGGGAGGVLTGYTYLTGNTYTITVGAGGAGGVGAGASYYGSNGGDSTFNGLTADGGGGGGGNSTAVAGSQSGGRDGGSGGGSSGYSDANTGGSGTVGQGHDGLDNNGTGYAGSGGGGMSVGWASSFGVPPTGGTGTFSTILGRPHYWGGGGGANSESWDGGQGGLGGGGGGSAREISKVGGRGGKHSILWGSDAPTVGASNSNGAAGAPWTGGGGGGGALFSGNGGAGGSGIVIIRYKYR